jgi:hypothetical protein
MIGQQPKQMPIARGMKRKSRSLQKEPSVFQQQGALSSSSKNQLGGAFYVRVAFRRYNAGYVRIKRGRCLKNTIIAFKLQSSGILKARPLTMGGRTVRDPQPEGRRR